MKSDINWNAVWQSITDTWLPLFGWIIIIVIAIILIRFIKNKKKVIVKIFSGIKRMTVMNTVVLFLKFN